MKTPAQIKAWLAQPKPNTRDRAYMHATLDYINNLEAVVAAYTKRDGVLAEPNRKEKGYADHNQGT